MHWIKINLLLSVFGCIELVRAQWYEGDPCITKAYEGRCIASSLCLGLEGTMTQMGLKAKHVGHCGFTVYEEVICCPKLNFPDYSSILRKAFTRTGPLTDTQLENFNQEDRLSAIILVTSDKKFQAFQTSNNIV